MKNKTVFPAILAGLVLVILSAVPARAAGTAVLDQVRGDVRIIPAGAPAETEGQPAAAGARVSPGESVQVGPDSEARLALPDGSRLEISARTRLVFSEDLSDPDAPGHLLGLIWGRVLSRVVPRKEGGSPFKLVTPSTVCGIRGTEFMVAVADDGETRVGVEKGEVEVSGADGTELIPAGMETSVSVGGRPLRPVRALLEKADWEGWLRERNARFREAMAPRIASLAEAARQLDSRLGQLNRRVQKLEAEARESARKRREAVESGDWDRIRDLDARLKSNLDEGVEVSASIAETRERRDLALASGEQAIRGETGWGGELPPPLRKLAGDLEAFRASMAERVRADQEVFGKRLQSFRDLLREYGRSAGELWNRPEMEQKLRERWEKLSPEKQAELKRKYEVWKSLPEETREKVLANWNRFREMSQAERREIVKNLREFERLGAAEKGRVRQQFERWRALSPEKRDDLRKKFRRFKSLPPEEREAILERLRARRTRTP